MSSLKNLYAEMHIDPERDASTIRIQRTETLMTNVVVNDRIQIDVPTDCVERFHPDTLEMLTRFNTLDLALQKAILICAKRVEAGLPELIRKALSEPGVKAKTLQDCIRMADWWTGPREQKETLLRHAETIIIKSDRSNVDKDILRTDLEARGLCIDWDAFEKLSVVPHKIWSEESVRRTTFCLVELPSNLPILHAHYCLGVVKAGTYGSYWKLDRHYKVLNNHRLPSGVYGTTGEKKPVDPTTFRVPHFLEIVAMLSSVDKVSGLPDNNVLAPIPAQ